VTSNPSTTAVIRVAWKADRRQSLTGGKNGGIGGVGDGGGVDGGGDGDGGGGDGDGGGGGIGN
jgi:hypothetical protein